MDAWGIGLYSSDYASDLRATIGAISRLPFAPDRVLQLLRENEGGTADDPEEEDYSNFWLTVADQFAARGIVCDAVRERAPAIIGDDTDLRIVERLGMTERDLKKRRAVWRRSEQRSWPRRRQGSLAPC